MNIAKATALAALLALGMACSYSSKSTMPATPGTMPNIAALVPGVAGMVDLEL
jgi:hypothetical protein